MKYRFFYVPKTWATLDQLMEAGIPKEEALQMLGKVFSIQYVSPAAEPRVYGVEDFEEQTALATLENHAERGVKCWTVPLTAVPCVEVRGCYWVAVKGECAAVIPPDAARSAIASVEDDFCESSEARGWAYGDIYVIWQPNTHTPGTWARWQKKWSKRTALPTP